MAPKRILYVNGGILDRGGITSYMMNYYRHFDKDVLQTDFIAHGGAGPMDAEILAAGGEIFHVPTKKENLRENIREIDRILDPERYALVHAHMDGMNGWILKIARKNGIPVRISHSHSTRHLTTNPVKIAIHDHIRKQIPKYATHLWACSEAAGRWLYGPKSDFEIIPNAIDTGKWRYRQETRQRLRAEYRLEEKRVIGHVGWMNYPKNQEFLISILPALCRRDPQIMLVLVGDGPNRAVIEKMIHSSGLTARVILTGERHDVEELINMFDLFVLPSFFEGFPVSLLEAQTNGLRCIVSDGITNEADVTGRVEFLPLSEEAWIDAITSCAWERRPDAADMVMEAGYDIISAAEMLQERYLELMR